MRRVIIIIYVPNPAQATCFAYGQTGSGKTYTMQPLPLRAAGDIFAYLALDDHRFGHCHSCCSWCAMPACHCRCTGSLERCSMQHHAATVLTTGVMPPEQSVCTTHLGVGQES